MNSTLKHVLAIGSLVAGYAIAAIILLLSR